MGQFSEYDEQTSINNSDILSLKDGTSGIQKRVLASTIKDFSGFNNPYKFSVYRAASQTGIADATITKVTFDTERFDTNNNFASNKYTVPVSGFYQINAFTLIQSADNTGVAGFISLYKNGVELMRRDHGYSTTVATFVQQGAFLSEIVQLTAADYLEIHVYMDVASSTVTVIGGSTGSSFSGFLVSKT